AARRPGALAHGGARPVGEQRDPRAHHPAHADGVAYAPGPRAQCPREPVRRGGAGRGLPDLAGHRAPRLAQHVRDLYCAGHREHLVRHRGGGLAELSRPRRTARRAVLGRDADGWDASDGARALDVPLSGARDQPHGLRAEPPRRRGSGPHRPAPSRWPGMMSTTTPKGEPMRAPRGVRSILAIACVIAVAATGAAAQDKPRYGGVLTWFDYGDPGRLDVHAESPLVVQQATAGVYSGLIQYDPDDPSKIVPDLAERWTVSPDGRTYTLHLRNGVKWHDGQPFSAADVKASFDRILNPDFKSPKCGAALKPMVASVEAIGPSTVQFRLKFAAAPFLGNVASSWCRVAAKHILEKYGDLNTPEAQIGTGPFRFKRYERGNLIEWEKNKDYFVRGLPYLDGVRQYILVGGPTQLAAAKAGRIMLWDAWPPMKRTQAEELQRARTDVDIYQASINTIFLLYMNAQKPPF